MLLRTEKLNLKRCLVPEGQFLMGSADENAFDEGPVHRVYVAAFEMAQTPVTNHDYGIFLKKAKKEPSEWWENSAFNDPEQPVVGVNWHEAKEYCEWLSKKTGHNIRLPTEAEFEKAARGGLHGKKYPWGDEVSAGRYRIKVGPLESPYKMKANPPNAYGLFDMVSNVHQWCLDGYDPNYYEESPERKPMGPVSFDRRAARGNSWKEDDLIATCAQRTSLAPYFRCDDFGFRWVIGFKVED